MSRPVRASRQRSAASFVPTNRRWPRIDDAAIDDVGFARVDHLLRTCEPPDLTSRARVDRRHGAGIAAAGAVHHPVHDERGALADVGSRHRCRPRRAEPGHVARVDLLQRGIVRALIVSPVHQPVVRFGSRIAQALVGHPSRQRRRGGGLVRIAPLQRAEVRDQVRDLGRGQSGGVVGRVQRGRLDGDRRQLQLVEQVQLSGRVHHLQGKRVFIAPDAANLPPVLRPRDHRRRRGGPAPAAAAPTTCRRHRAVRVDDLLAQLRGREPAGIRQVGADDPAAPVDVVAGRAARLTEEQRFAGGGVAARRSHGAGGLWCCLQAAHVAHELPDLGVGQCGSGRHLRAGHAGANRAEEIGVRVAVHQRGLRQRRTAIAALAARPVARLTGLVEQPRSLSHGRGVQWKRVRRARRGLLSREHHGATRQPAQTA